MSCKGIVFALELGLLSLKEKTAIRKRITDVHGTISAIVGSSVRVLIATSSEIEKDGYKVAAARSLGIPIFPVDELDLVLFAPPSPRQAPPKRTTSLFFSTELEISDTPAYEPASESVWDSSGFGSFFGSDDAFGSSDPTPSPIYAHTEFTPATVAPVEVDDADDWISGFADSGYDEDVFVSAYVPPVLPTPTPHKTSSPSHYGDVEDEESFVFGISLWDDDYGKSTQIKSVPIKNPKNTSVVVPPKPKVQQPVPHLPKEPRVPYVLPKRTGTSAAAQERAAKYQALVNKPTVGLKTSFSSPLATSTFTTAPTFTSSVSSVSFSQFTFSVGNKTPIEVKPIKSFNKSYLADLPPLAAPITFESTAVTQYEAIVECEAIVEGEVDHDLHVGDNGVASPRSVPSVQSGISTPTTIPNETLSEVSSQQLDEEALGEEFEEDEEYDDLMEAEVNSFDAEEGPEDLNDGGSSSVVPVDSNVIVPKVRERRPRVYVEKLTGFAWSLKKPEKIPALVLESSHGPTKVVRIDSVDIGESFPSIGGGSAKPHKSVPRVSGSINPKFTWTDIVTGKATTKKFVPALDGLKLFVSGFTFADIILRSKPREEQLVSYKEAYLKKEKDKNAKTMKKLKKKAKRTAMAKAEADADGKVSVPKAEKVKLSDNHTLRRLKTDAQLLDEIVLWTQKRVDAAIEQRKVLILDIFKHFGTVDKFVPEWGKGFLFVVYKSPHSAKAAFRSLSDFDIRAGVVRRLKENFAKVAKECFPSPCFYVRWTACYQRKLDRKEKEKVEKSLARVDAKVAKQVTSALAAVAKVSA